MKTSNRQLGGGSSGMHPERREKLEAVKCDHLTAHPLSVKIYGRPKPSKEFLISIETHGLLQPIIINDYQDGSYEILAGNTRVAAWRMLWEQKRIKSSWIPCRILHLSPLEAECLIIESNRQREKTAGQKARESNELVRIFAATQDVKSAIARIARETKQGVRTVNKQIMIVTEAEARNAAAQEALAQLDKNQTSVSAAYRGINPQRRTLHNTPLGSRLATLETLAQKLPNDLKDPANKEFLTEARARISAAIERLKIYDNT